MIVRAVLLASWMSTNMSLVFVPPAAPRVIFPSVTSTRTVAIWNRSDALGVKPFTAVSLSTVILWLLPVVTLASPTATRTS